LYVTVDDLVRRVPLAPRPGPAPALRVSEVVTLALFGPWRHFGGERAGYRYARRHLRAACPTLPHRGQDHRLLRRGQDVLGAVGQRLAQRRDAPTCAYAALDAVGLAPRHVKRRGSGWLDGPAAKGWWTRWGFCHGCTLLAAVTPRGAITGYGLSLTPTSAHARAATFLAARHPPQPARPEVGTSACHVDVAATGFAGRAWWRQWAQDYGAHVSAPPTAHATRARRWPQALRRAHAGWRQISATLNERLLQTFGLEHERPQALQGLRARLAAKVGLHNVCLGLNLQLGRPPLACAALVDW
jgi:hypothetical protein